MHPRKLLPVLYQTSNIKTELFTCKESKNHLISFGFDFQKYGNHKNMKQYTKYECINSYLSYVIYFLPFVVATLSGILPKKCVQIRDIMKMQKIYDIWKIRINSFIFCI